MSRSLRALIPLTSLLLLACPGRDDHHANRFDSRVGAPPRADSAAHEQRHAEAAQGEPTKLDPGVKQDGSIVFALEWFDGSLEQALAAASAQDKLVFVDVGAYWCPPCHELDEKTFTDAKVGAWLRERTIPLHIDAEKGEGPELVERYHVQAYPTLLVLEATGIEKARIVDFHEPAALIERLESIAAGGNVLADLAAKVEAAPDDLEARYELGHAYALAAQRELAEAEYEKVLAGDPDNAKRLASKVLFDRAAFFVHKLDNDPERAITAYRALQERFPTSDEAIPAYRMIGRAYCQLERPDEAVLALEAMVATDPQNVGLKSSFGWFAFREDCRPDAGLKAVQAGLVQEPENAGLHYLEAELQRMLGQPELALAAIRKASELEPESAYFKRQVRRFEAIAAGQPDPLRDVN